MVATSQPRPTRRIANWLSKSSLPTPSAWVLYKQARLRVQTKVVKFSFVRLGGDGSCVHLCFYGATESFFLEEHTYSVRVAVPAMPFPPKKQEIRKRLKCKLSGELAASRDFLTCDMPSDCAWPSHRATALLLHGVKLVIQVAMSTLACNALQPRNIVLRE